MTYYNIEEYPIVTGSPSSGIALCVGWQDAFKLVSKYPMLSDQCAIVGSLYLAQGINAMIRNLALNPGIRVLYLWRQGKESLSQRGIHATTMLLRLWDEGVDDSGMCNDFMLEKEIPIDSLNQIRESVNIRIIDAVPLHSLPDVLETVAADPYMRPQNFPDPVYEAPAVFPSEQTGFVIRRETIYEAWLEILFHIERFGEFYGDATRTKRLCAFTWIAENESGGAPDCVNVPKALQRNLSVSQDLILEYVKENFLQHRSSPTGAYTYGDRLHNWGEGFNQVEAVIRLLQKSTDTRRAFLSTTIPNADLLEENYPPCLVGIHFLKDGAENLDAFAVFRSHDIFQAGLSNAFGIVYLLRHIAREVGMEQGKVVITSHDAHIYMRDIKDVRQVVQCAWGNKSLTLSDADMDPRGSFLIRLTDNKIAVDLVNNSGQLLQQFSGTGADTIGREIALNHLMSQSEHGCYLGIQLARAEECLRRDLPFVQDEPVPLEKNTSLL